ncbi:MAG TPA: intradiol ring-cleavage dioxygenase [Solirubrobacteraceae bacterium]|nr:intradiol ring-cleavage dioxygenase [Solirubrobacteraceae bacterium]
MLPGSKQFNPCPGARHARRPRPRRSAAPRDPHSEQAGVTRRGALARIGAGGLGLASLGGGLGGLVLASSGDATEQAYAASCALTPELTEGPYYLDLRTIRQNITEGRPGLRLDLRVRVVDAATCKPIDNVAVDIWHADAAGRYSGIASEGTSGKTYLRGIQLTDSSGLARIRTIYPGWYQGRATHIHVTAHVGGKAGTTYSGGTRAHTGQFFFRDATTDKVAKLSPYAKRTVARVRNSADNIYRQGGSGQVLSLKQRGTSIRSGFTGTIAVAIDV